jgi:hypothetical protein
MVHAWGNKQLNPSWDLGNAAFCERECRVAMRHRNTEAAQEPGGLRCWAVDGHHLVMVAWRASVEHAACREAGLPLVYPAWLPGATPPARSSSAYDGDTSASSAHAATMPAAALQLVDGSRLLPRAILHMHGERAEGWSLSSVGPPPSP